MSVSLRNGSRPMSQYTHRMEKGDMVTLGDVEEEVDRLWRAL